MLEGCEMLAAKDCVPCKGGVAPLAGHELHTFHAQLGSDWHLVEDHHLTKGYKFKDFKEALAFTNEVGAIAEGENHHPDILTTYGNVEVTIWTHKIDGLCESDFVFAAKVEKAYEDAL